MKLSLVLFAVAAVGLVVGAWLVGTWMVGVAIMLEAIALAGYALIRDVPDVPQPRITSLPDVLEKYRDQA